MAEILPKWLKTLDLINKSNLQELQGHLGVVLEFFAFVSSPRIFITMFLQC
jgi:hypothetical protein